jgi:predicted negative regulator of RcsB-dependent stress response
VFFAVYILKRKLFNVLKINSNHFFYYLNEKKIIYFFLLTLIIITPWQLRNFIDKGEYTQVDMWYNTFIDKLNECEFISIIPEIELLQKKLRT